MPPHILDPATMKSLVDLSEQGGGKLLPAMVEAFLDDECPSGIEQLTLAAAAGDQPAIARVAHKLRGSCATFGALRLTQVCTELESEAKAGALTAPAELLDRLNAELTDVAAELTRYRAPKG